MQALVSFIAENHQQIVESAVAVVMAARLIVKLTPTPRDDSFLEGAITWLKHLGLHIDKK